MTIDFPGYVVMNLINDIPDRISYARELGVAAGVKTALLDLYNEVEEEIKKLKCLIETGKFSMEYANQLGADLNRFIGGFPSSYRNCERGPITLKEDEKLTFKEQQERYEPEIEKALLQFRITAEFFTSLDFFNRDLVIIGSNGSGKTSLAKHFTTHIRNNGILISAQRMLTLPAYESIRSYTTTVEHVKSIQLPDEELTKRENLADEFGILIEHLLADDSRALKQNRSQRDNPLPPSTKLQVLLMIWNSLFSHLQISLPDDINIEAEKESMAFHVSEMSDGEKVALFLIAHVLLCPENGFVIVDEPEMYLHPLIHKKLWDRLETERSDAIFIYVTHDLDFASSRVKAKKLWLRSFAYPDQFLLEEIPKNEIPIALLMELLGSRQDILFCEGEVGSLDEQVYGILFPNYTIKPVGGCLSVIDFTKAFNKVPMSTRKAIGVIDGDYVPHQRIQSLQNESIYTLAIPHIENLLLDEKILLGLAQQLSQDAIVEEIQGRVLKKLEEESEFEVAKYVSAKVDHYFKDSNVSAGKDSHTIKSNLKSFMTKVDIDGWTNERAQAIDKVISTKNYIGALKIFKNKGLATIAESAFGIKGFNQKAIDLLRRSESLQTEVRNYFPAIPMIPKTE